MKTIQRIRQEILHRETTVVETVQGFLDRIEQLEPQINAWVHVDEQGSLQQAKRLQDQLDNGKAVGPLFGIPIGVKDIVDVKGLPVEAGTKYRHGTIAETDAPVVERLRDLGAIILGKTVTTELACFDPPITKNPWNLEHTPGGSSSGSAAAVATGMCAAAIGSQTGGSITRPASYCGVAGWKPTFDQAPLRGVEPVTFHLDHVGPLARTVSDLVAFADLFIDSNSASDGSFSKRKPRIGVLRDFFLEECDDETRQVVDDVTKRLSDNGAQVSDASLPAGFEGVHKMHWRIMAIEAAHFHGADFQKHTTDFGPKVASLIVEGLESDLFDYTKALDHRKVFHHTVDHMWNDLDAILTPATPTAAPRDLSTTGDPRFNSPWSYAGIPTVSFPCGLTKTGLPMAVQLIGKRNCDRELLDIAAWCETQIDFRTSSNEFGVL